MQTGFITVLKSNVATVYDSGAGCSSKAVSDAAVCCFSGKILHILNGRPKDSMKNAIVRWV